MSFTPVTEFFTGGIVTTRHPALLNAGELQRADDCVYRDKDPAIWRAPGRVALNTAFSATRDPLGHGVKGISHLSFENSRTDQIVAYVGTTLWRSDFTGIAGSPASTLSFSEISGPGLIAGTSALSGSDEIFTATTYSITDGTIAAGGLVVTTAQDISMFRAGQVVSGTGITAGTIIASIDSSTQFTLGTAATPGTGITITATQYPFLVDAIGSRVFTGTSTVIVKAVSSQNGTTGHYNVVTFASAPPSHTTTSYAFEWGIVQRLEDNGATDEIMEMVQFGAKYYAWFGRGDLRQLKWMKRKSIGTDGTSTSTAPDDVLVMRPCGLNPVTQVPTLAIITTIDTVACAWPPTLSTGYYWFMLTEIMDPQDKGSPDADEREGAYLAVNSEKQSKGDPVPIQISSLTGQGVAITTPAVQNNGADGRIASHWGVYMAGPTSDNQTPPSMASFRRVACRQIKDYAGGEVINISENRSSQQFFPSVNKGGADGRPDMSSPSFMLGVWNGVYARSKSGSSTSGDEQHTGVSKLGFGTQFNTGAPWATRTITGIQVQVRGAADPSGNAGRDAGYYVYVTDGTKTTPPVYSAFGSKNMHTNYHGGEMDTWGTAFVIADLDADLSVVIGKTGTGSRQRLRIDGIQLIIYFSSGTINLFGKPYRVVTYRDQIGTTVNQPANGMPKECSTATFFQGCFVTNDKGDETAVRFSLPGGPEQMPGPYVMRFNTAQRKDTVTCVRALGQIMVVGLFNSIKRVNVLPRETLDLGDGTVQEDLTVDHGIAGPLCAVKIDIPGIGTMLFYVSNTGVYLTDGQTTRPANMDLDWPNTVKLSALSSAVVRVYPREKWITLDYCPAGATHTKNTKRLVFCYSGDKVKQGGFFPCTGPLTVSGRSSCEVIYQATNYLFTGHESNGIIYLEDSGTTQASGYQVHNASGTLADAPIVPIIKSRRFYPAGFDRDAYGEALYLLFSSYGANTVTATGALDKTTASVTVSSVSGTIVKGMRVLGVGLDPGIIVMAVAGSVITLSRAPNTTMSSSLRFDTGTLGVTVRGNGIGEIPLGLSTDYVSTLVGDLVQFNRSNIRRGFEFQIEKVPLTFDTSTDVNGLRYETATWADLDTNMRLHNVTYMVEDAGPDTNRSAV